MHQSYISTNRETKEHLQHFVKSVHQKIGLHRLYLNDKTLTVCVFKSFLLYKTEQNN